MCVIWLILGWTSLTRGPNEATWQCRLAKTDCMGSNVNPDELATLRAENARLVALLEAKGIDWKSLSAKPSPVSTSSVVEPTTTFTTEDKVALFRRLFRGRADVYPLRWESKSSGKSGYSPACANEWRAGVCEKPRIKCSDCDHRSLIPLSDEIIYRHLSGEHTLGGSASVAPDRPRPRTGCRRWRRG